jgi:hypothetical protein
MSRAPLSHLLFTLSCLCVWAADDGETLAGLSTSLPSGFLLYEMKRSPAACYLQLPSGSDMMWKCGSTYKLIYQPKTAIHLTGGPSQSASLALHAWRWPHLIQKPIPWVSVSFSAAINNPFPLIYSWIQLVNQCLVHGRTHSQNHLLAFFYFLLTKYTTKRLLETHYSFPQNAFIECIEHCARLCIHSFTFWWNLILAAVLRLC